MPKLQRILHLPLVRVSVLNAAAFLAPGHCFDCHQENEGRAPPDIIMLDPPLHV